MRPHDWLRNLQRQKAFAELTLLAFERSPIGPLSSGIWENSFDRMNSTIDWNANLTAFAKHENVYVVRIDEARAENIASENELAMNRPYHIQHREEIKELLQLSGLPDDRKDRLLHLLAHNKDILRMIDETIGPME